MSTRLARAAELALDGVGDARLGQWHHDTGKAVHMRRRLSVVEEAAVGPVLDVRGTREAAARLALVRRWLPAGWSE